MEDIETKIIATIGPASLDLSVLEKLVAAGIDFIRINSAYGNEDQYNLIRSNLDKASGDKDIPVIFDVKDLDKLQYASRHNLKRTALSFVAGSQDVKEVRNVIPDAFVISKIESKPGVENFDGILSVSDGIMVARGDLAHAVSLEKVPALQKEFTYKTLQVDKFLVTATEMLLSMVRNSKPTRAEVSDVANAVFEKTSAVMLSEETAVGKYPVESVKMMRRIIVEAEKWNKRKEADNIGIG